MKLHLGKLKSEWTMEKRSEVCQVYLRFRMIKMVPVNIIGFLFFLAMFSFLGAGAEWESWVFPRLGFAEYDKLRENQKVEALLKQEEGGEDMKGEKQ